jgi:hypothetical protein
MLAALEEYFEKKPARKSVAVEMLRLGLRVDGKGRIYAGKIEVPPSKISRAIGVDRRVVIDTARDISLDDELYRIFFNLEPRAFLGGVAKGLGLSMIILRADPHRKGVIARVTGILSESGVLIRQLISDDPDIFPDPVLTIIIDGKLDSKVLESLRSLEFAESITIA